MTFLQHLQTWVFAENFYYVCFGVALAAMFSGLISTIFELKKNVKLYHQLCKDKDAVIKENAELVKDLQREITNLNSELTATEKTMQLAQRQAQEYHGDLQKAKEFLNSSEEYKNKVYQLLVNYFAEITPVWWQGNLIKALSYSETQGDTIDSLVKMKEKFFQLGVNLRDLIANATANDKALTEEEHSLGSFIAPEEQEVNSEIHVDPTLIAVNYGVDPKLNIGFGHDS